MHIRTVRYNMDESALQKALLRTSFRTLRSLTIVCVVAGISLAGLGLLDRNSSNVVSGGVFVVLGIVAPFLSAHLGFRNSMRSPLMKLPFVTEFTDTHILQTSGDTVDSKFGYDTVTRVIEIPEGLQIYMTGRTFALIPRSAFASNEDYEAVSGLLRQKGLLKSR